MGGEGGGGIGKRVSQCRSDGNGHTPLRPSGARARNGGRRPGGKRTAVLVGREVGERRRLPVAVGVVDGELGDLEWASERDQPAHAREVGGRAAGERERENERTRRALLDPQMRRPPMGAKSTPMMKSVGRTVLGVRMGCQALSRCCLKAVSGGGKRASQRKPSEAYRDGRAPLARRRGPIHVQRRGSAARPHGEEDGMLLPRPFHQRALPA